MSLQVGSVCYASPVDAGSAACAAFVPVSSISGGQVQTVSCGSSDSTTGALNLTVSSTNISSGVTSSIQISQLQTFPPCAQGDFIAAFEVLFAGLLGLWAMWYGGSKLIGFLGWSRGQDD